MKRVTPRSMSLSRVRRGAGTALALFLTLVLAAGHAQSASLPTLHESSPASPTGIIKAPYEVTVDLPSEKAQVSSPVLGDLDHNPAHDLEIIVGTRDGWVFALHSDGSILWSYQTRSALDSVAEVSTETTVRSSPCLADLDGDGWLEVIIGVGTVGSAGENGGVLVLDHRGNLMPGWPVLTFSQRESGATDGVVSSPAAGDLDNDGLLEVVFGAFDQRVYAIRLDGTPLEGWPVFVHDTVWSSPAIADLDQDGFSEVVIGTDSHHSDYWGLEDGGHLHVFDHQGKERGGFPKHVPQIISSSPALADLDGDGFLDIIVGTGTYYSGTGGYRVFAWDRHGNALPGWPVSTGGDVPGSPAVGDVDGDGYPEVVVGAHDKKIWVWNHDGSVMWWRTPKDWTGTSRTLGSPILADYDNDGKLEIFFSFGWEVGVRDHNGSRITWNGIDPNPGQLTYYTNSTLSSPPAVADIDHDGTLELVAAGGYNGGANGRVYVWELDQSSASGIADWPMFRKDAFHSARQHATPQYDAQVASVAVPDVVREASPYVWQVAVRNSGTDAWDSSGFGLTGDSPGFSPVVSFFPLAPGEVIPPGGTRVFTVPVSTPSTAGFYPVSWRMFAPGVGSFGAQVSREIKVGQQPALYVFAREPNPAPNESVYPGGIAPGLGAVNTPSDFNHALAMDLRPDGSGYYLLNRFGALYWGGAAPDFGGWATLESRDLVIAPDGNGIYRLGTDGQVDKTVGLPTIGSVPQVPNARSLAITRNGRGVYVLDAYGGLHRGGTAPALSPSTPTWTSAIARRVKLTADQTGYYVLDTYGRVHAGGSAVDISPNYDYHIGEDWARDFDLTEDSLGYYMVDKHGRIHIGGTAVELTVNPPPIWPNDMAVDLELTDSRLLQEPDLGPNISSISFMVDDEGDGIRSHTRHLVNQGAGETLNWTASISPTVTWLSVIPDSGVTPGELHLSVPSVPSQGVGIYETQLIVEAYLNADLVDTIAATVQLLIVDEVRLTHLPQLPR